MTEPKIPRRAAFSMPTLSGHEQLQDLVRAYGGSQRVINDFRIAPELLRAYLAGVMEPPFTLLLAVYWQSPYGFEQAFSETHWANQANYQRAQVAEAKLQQYSTLLELVRPHVAGFDTLCLSYGINAPTRETMQAITGGSRDLSPLPHVAQ